MRAQPLLPLVELEYDSRSAARLLMFSARMGRSVFISADDTELREARQADYLPIHRIVYGSPLKNYAQAALYFASYVVFGTPTVLRF